MIIVCCFFPDVWCFRQPAYWYLYKSWYYRLVTKPLSANFSYSYTVGPGYKVRLIKKVLASSDLATSRVEKLKSDMKIKEGKSLWRFREIPTFLWNNNSLPYPNDQSTIPSIKANKNLFCFAVLPYLRFSCHSEPTQECHVWWNSASICRWPPFHLHSPWFPYKSLQAALEWHRE